MKQPSENRPKPAFWAKAFLAINLLALAVFFTWMVAGNSLKTKKELAQDGKMQEKLVQETLEKNPEPRDLSGTLSEPIVYTINATKKGVWVHFSFSTMSVNYSPKINRDSTDWDIAFHRAKIVTNGGATNPKGNTAVALASTADFDSIIEAPVSGYVVDQPTANPREYKNPVLDPWYVYDFWTHKLTPQKAVYVIKTTNGDYVKMLILDYYCGTIAACYTIKYVFQGQGTRSFAG